MAEKGTELWLFTMRFPFGHGEAFLENELPFLAERFGSIRLFPLLAEGEVRPLPLGVEVERPFTLEEAYRPMAAKELVRAIGRYWHVWRLGRRSAPSPAVFRKHRAEFRSQLRQALERERLFRLRYGSRFDPKKVRLYSYWTSDWATVLGLWKLRDPRVRFVSRMMGFDMFDHRAADGWQRFQRFHVEQVERVYTIARAGLQHMQERFPGAKDKFRLSYLATRDHGAAQWAPSDILRIVSCSNLVELKRVPLIADAFRQVDGPVQWTHFGDGPERAALEQAVAGLPAKVEVRLMGSRPNSEVIQWYRNNPVDVFVHASRTEGGAPVALQEAASFGIPLIAAEAGGVAEIVTPDTGVLLPNALDADELGKALADFRHSPWYGTESRARVRRFWADHFDAAQVYRAMAADLLT